MLAVFADPVHRQIVPVRTAVFASVAESILMTFSPFENYDLSGFMNRFLMPTGNCGIFAENINRDLFFSKIFSNFFVFSACCSHWMRLSKAGKRDESNRF